MSEGRLCVKLITDQADYDTQVKNCRAMFPGADLIYIPDATTEGGLKSRINKWLAGNPAQKTCHDSGFWIGLTRVERNNCQSTFAWQSIATKSCKPAYDYKDWWDGQPDCTNGESCVQLIDGLMYKTGFAWNDAPCENKGCAVCAIPGY
jgi:hypothetical protein